MNVQMKVLISHFITTAFYLDSSDEPRGWQPPSSYRYNQGDRYGLRQYMTISKYTFSNCKRPAELQVLFSLTSIATS